jgi:hypothetical protein
MEPKINENQPVGREPPRRIKKQNLRESKSINFDKTEHF